MPELCLLGDAEPLPPSDDFLQSDFWARFKGAAGWKPYRARLRAAGRDGSMVDSPLLLLARNLAPGFSFAYVPHGPHLPRDAMPPSHADDSGRGLEKGDFVDLWARGDDPVAALREVAAKASALLPPGTAFIRFDLAHPETGDPSSEPGAARNIDLGKPFWKAAAEVQPPDTVIVDLSRGEAAVLAAMKNKWRYNVRLAEKKGVAVECVRASGHGAGDLAEAIDSFYALYEETARRDRIALHSKSYYLRLLELGRAMTANDRGGEILGAETRPDLRIWFARHEGKLLASIITLYMGGRATYLYGASSDEKRELMPAYALQWAAMRGAMVEGCRSYDLFGIPPTDDEAHPMHGLYRFKTGFGGRIVHRPGCWDYPLRPFAYRLYRLAERARNFYFKSFLKKLGR
jgi:lipid II:glycine glycyltransferase (peptidoglycan interpeptide bridge formation enzyme)